MKEIFGSKVLGRTGLSVSRLGVGTTAIGGLYSSTSEAGAEQTLNSAWDIGVRFFDTAPQYGNGMAESRLGAFLKRKPSSEYVVCTKVGRLLRLPENPVVDDYYKGTPPERPVFDFSYDGVMTSVEESLNRLGLDRIDVLHIHDPDTHYKQAIEGAYKALDRLRSDGTIGAVGAGMNQSEMLTEFALNGNFDCFLLAGRYTLLEQGALKNLLPICVQKDISIIIGGVYNSGILANPSAGAKFNYQDADRELVQRALTLEKVCLKHGVPLKAAAIQFPTAHPAVASVLTGPRTPEEMEENAKLFTLPIPQELWHELKAEGLISLDSPTA